MSRGFFSAAECVLLDKLKSHGVAASVAAEIVAKWPERIEPQIHGLGFRRNIGNVAGYLVRAIQHDYPVSEKLRSIRERDAEPRAVEPKMSREQKLLLELQAQQATDAMLDQLPEEIKYTLRLQADEYLAQRKFLANFPADIKRKMHRAHMLELAQQLHDRAQVSA